jgi:hypothetical protein
MIVFSQGHPVWKDKWTVVRYANGKPDREIFHVCDETTFGTKRDFLPYNCMDCPHCGESVPPFLELQYHIGD